MVDSTLRKSKQTIKDISDFWILKISTFPDINPGELKITINRQYEL